MAFMELEDYEREARHVRLLIGIDDQMQPDVMTVIVKLKHFGFINDYHRVPDNELPEHEALWDPEDRVIRMRESVFCAANNQISDPHARWTFWHEVGHAVRGHNRVRHRSISEQPIEKIAPSIRRDEREAHGIAAALSAPAHLVEDPITITARDLARRFNISFAAAKIRKTELERMYRRAHNIPRPLPEKGAAILEDAKKRNKTRE